MEKRTLGKYNWPFIVHAMAGAVQLLKHDAFTALARLNDKPWLRVANQIRNVCYGHDLSRELLVIVILHTAL